MAWTYDPTLPTDKDRVRFMIGDTLEEDQQLQDSELEFLIEQHGSLNGAAAFASRALAAKYARYADKWVGDLKILASQKSRAYAELAKTFEAQAALTLASNGVPTAGGVYVGDKEEYNANSELSKPYFWRNIHDYE